MDIIEWYHDTVAGDSGNKVAERSALNQPTLSRQLNAGRLSPTCVAAIARTYGADVIEALVIQGLLTHEDVRSSRMMREANTSPEA